MATGTDGNAGESPNVDESCVISRKKDLYVSDVYLFSIHLEGISRFAHQYEIELPRLFKRHRVAFRASLGISIFLSCLFFTMNIITIIISCSAIIALTILWFVFGFKYEFDKGWLEGSLRRLRDSVDIIDAYLKGEHPIAFECLKSPVIDEELKAKLVGEYKNKAISVLEKGKACLARYECPD